MTNPAFRNFQLYLAVLCVCIVSPARASLIGDTVTLDWLFNGSPCAVCSTINVNVVAGPADTASPNPSVIAVNVEESSILTQFVTSGFATPGVFNGLVVSDLDWVGVPSGEVVGVIIDTNIVGFDASRVSFGTDNVSFNFETLDITPSSFMNAFLETTHSGVPEPATILLLGLGLAGLGFARRRIVLTATSR